MNKEQLLELGFKQCGYSDYLFEKDNLSANTKTQTINLNWDTYWNYDGDRLRYYELSLDSIDTLTIMDELNDDYNRVKNSVLLIQVTENGTR